MEQLITETGELKIKRTAYMQFLMNSTYAGIAIEAIKRGFTGAWERLIANQLYQDIYNDQNPQAFELLDLTGDTNYTKETFLKAAYLVTGSKIQNIT